MHLVIGTDVSETISILPRNLNRIADHSHSLLLVVICHDLSSFFWSFIRRNDGNEHAFTGLAAGQKVSRKYSEEPSPAAFSAEPSLRSAVKRSRGR